MCLVFVQLIDPVVCFYFCPVKETRSPTQQIKCGVPQGSILGSSFLCSLH